MNLTVKETRIPECYQLFPKIYNDIRGAFIKTYHKEVFIEYGLNEKYEEMYYSVSKKNVLRGMHFQLPPFEHFKLVYCVHGNVKDAVIDLRVGSPTYGQYEMFVLTDERGNMIYVPPGLAHGFYVLSDSAILIYNVSTMYSEEHDYGILWNSCGIPWGNINPIISSRDSSFLNFNKFKSPFKYHR